MTSVVQANEVSRANLPWYLVGLLGTTQIVGWGSVYYLFAVLLEPMQRELGASKSVVVAAFSWSLLLCGALSPAVGRYIDHHGGRKVMALGSLLAVAGLVLLSLVSTLWQLYAVWTLLGLAMAAMLYEPAFAVLTRAFANDYRRAITLLTLFGGFASSVFWPLTQWLNDHYGWRQAVLALAAINLFVALPLHCCLPRADERKESAATKLKAKAAWTMQQVLRDPVFYLLCAAFTANAWVFSAVGVHLLSMLAAKGLTAAQAAWLGALIGPMQVLGRFTEMMLGQRVASAKVGLVAMMLLPLALLVFYFNHNTLAGFICFAMLYGCGNGAMTIVRGTVPVEFYGQQHYGAVNGAMAAPVLIARALGPTAAAISFIWAGSYDQVVASLMLIALVSVVMFIAALRLRAAQVSVQSAPAE